MRVNLWTGASIGKLGGQHGRSPNSPFPIQINFALSLGVKGEFRSWGTVQLSYARCVYDMTATLSLPEESFLANIILEFWQVKRRKRLNIWKRQ